MEKDVHIYLPGETLPINSTISHSSETKKMYSETKFNNNYSVACIPCVKVDLPIYPFAPTLMGNPKIYYPSTGDIVIGLITNVHSEGFHIDINSPYNAYLSIQNLSKSSEYKKKKIYPNSLVLARVVSTGIPSHALFWDDLVNNQYQGRTSTIQAEKQKITSCYHNLFLNDSCELSCIKSCDSVNKSEINNYFGLLPNDHCTVFDLPIPVCISLQSDDCYILERLGKLVQYEIAVGANGRVWIRTESINNLNFVSQVLFKSIGLKLSEIEAKLPKWCERYGIEKKK